MTISITCDRSYHCANHVIYHVTFIFTYITAWKLFTVFGLEHNIDQKRKHSCYCDTALVLVCGKEIKCRWLASQNAIKSEATLNVSVRGAVGWGFGHITSSRWQQVIWGHCSTKWEERVGDGWWEKRLQYLPPCCRLRGRLSQTETFHFGSSLHLKKTKMNCKEYSAGLGGLR